MSDYLTNAANRADAISLPAIRPRVRSAFEGPPAPVFIEWPKETPAQPSRGILPTAPGSRDGESHPPALAPHETSRSVPSAIAESPSLTAASAAALPGAHHPHSAVFVRPIIESQRSVSTLRKSELAPSSASTPRVFPQFDSKNPAPYEKIDSTESISSAEASPLHPTQPFSVPLLAPPKAELRTSAGESAPSPPAVTVTIGRLEIRAAPIPEKPRPAAQAAARGALPLDEFLRSKSARQHTIS